MKKLLLPFLLLSLVLAWPVSRAWADDCDTYRQVFGDSFTLASGDALNSSLVVFGGNVIIEAEATVKCKMVIYGGNVDIAGTVGDDVTLFGGNLTLHDTAVVDGTVTTVGGSFAQDTGAEVTGGVSQGFNFNGPNLDFLPRPYQAVRSIVEFLLGLLWAGAVATLAALAALAVVFFMPTPMARVSAALTTAPLASGLLGFLSLFAVPIVLVLVALTICLSPLSLVGGVLLGVGLIVGWLALGYTFGAQIAKAFKLTLSPAVWATGGTFILTLLMQLADLTANYADVLSRFGGGGLAFLLSCTYGLVALTLTSLGLGAVILTRFGTRPYLGSTPSAPSAPPPALISDVGETAPAQ